MLGPLYRYINIVGNMNEINAKKAYYIKLGTSGEWAPHCIDNSTINLGYYEIAHETVLTGNEKLISNECVSKSDEARTRDARQILKFYDRDPEILWVTFYKGYLYWCNAHPDVEYLGRNKNDHRYGSRIRKTINGWCNTDRNGHVLEMTKLSDELKKLFYFQGTICEIKSNEFDYLIRKINDDPIGANVATQSKQNEIISANIVCCSFEKGRVYNRRLEIHGVYGGQRQGGISTPAKVPAIFLFTGESGEQYGYHDGPDENGVFLYTGEGQSGDMRFVSGNRAIRDHALDGKTLFLFQALKKKGLYRFLGEYACSSYELRSTYDVHKTQRQVIVFHLVPVDEMDTIELAIEEKSKYEAMSLEEARTRAYASAQAQEGKPGKIGKRTYRSRSEDVRQYVLKRAVGACESCEKPAPFITINGLPYLEPHHVQRLSDNGLDHPMNVGAICPTCHREIHYGHHGAKKNETLKEKIRQLEQHKPKRPIA